MTRPRVRQQQPDRWSAALNITGQQCATPNYMLPYTQAPPQALNTATRYHTYKCPVGSASLVPAHHPCSSGATCMQVPIKIQMKSCTCFHKLQYVDTRSLRGGHIAVCGRPVQLLDKCPLPALQSCPDHAALHSLNNLQPAAQARDRSCRL